jgi:hypothetical protein
MPATLLTYNGFDLNSTTVMTDKLTDSGQPDRDVTIFNLSRAPGGVVTDSTFRTKPISISGTILGTSQADIETRIDAFNAAMAVTNKNLDIGYASSTRRYVCTPQKVAVNRPVRGTNWASFEIDFIATEYGKDISATSLITTVANTTASYTPSITIGGSAPLQPLLITIVITAATGLVGKTITITTAGGLILTIRRTWTVGETLVIDEAAYSVKVNGIDVEWSGFFPSLEPSASAQVLTFGNDFTTRTLTYTIAQTKRYL